MFESHSFIDSKRPRIYLTSRLHREGRAFEPNGQGFAVHSCVQVLSLLADVWGRVEMDRDGQTLHLGDVTVRPDVRPSQQS